MTNRAAPEPSPRNGQVAEVVPSLQVLSKELENEIKKGKLQISTGVRGLTISFKQAALFPSGEDEIAEDTYPSIRKSPPRSSKFRTRPAWMPHRCGVNSQFAVSKQLEAIGGAEHRAARC
jgi:hypothetical protein